MRRWGARQGCTGAESLVTGGSLSPRARRASATQPSFCSGWPLLGSVLGLKIIPCAHAGAPAAQKEACGRPHRGPRVGQHPRAPQGSRRRPVCACPLFGATGASRGGVCSNARGLLTASPAEAAARARDPGQHVSNVPQTGASDQSECPARGSRLQARGRQSDCAWQSPRPRHLACASRHPVLPPGDRVVVGLAVSSHESTGGSKTQSTGSQAVALPRDMTFSATFPATKNSHCQN